MFLSILYTLIKIVLIYSILIFIYNKYKLYHFNGPLALPIFGNLYKKKAFRFIHFINDCKHKYGKIFLFWSGTKPMIVICDTFVTRNILSDNNTFEKGEDYTQKFSFVFGNGLVTSNGEKHKNSRKCLGRFFVKNNVDNYLSMMCQSTNKMIEEKLENNVNKKFDVQNFFHILSLRIFGKFSLDIDYSEKENVNVAEDINKDVKIGSNLIGKHIIMNIPMLSFLPSIKILDKIVKRIDKHIENIIKLRKKNDGSDKDDILNQLLLDNNNKDIFHQIRTLLSAGHDTTAFFGCYMIYLLSHNQKVQDKIKEEVDRVLKGKKDITSSNINEMKYCRMVMLETLRLYTIIPFLTRKSVKDYQIKDTKLIIPKNTTVLIPLTVINRDSDNWENPNEFNPERFRDVNGTSIPKKGYLPFGYGLRTCIGNTLAISEGIIMLALIMQEYRVLPDLDFKPKIIAGISLISKNGINVILKKDKL